MHTQTTTTGNHAHTFTAPNFRGTFTAAEVDRYINQARPESIRDEARRMALHQTAYNELGRARAELMRVNTDYAEAVQHAESAIAAMAALALMNGRA